MTHYDSYRDDPRLEGKSAGRCRPCGSVYLWKRSAKRSLSRARCPRCYRRLAQTTARNLKRSSARLVEMDPLFVEHVKTEAGVVHLEPKSVGVWRAFLNREHIGSIQRWEQHDWAWGSIVSELKGRERSMSAATRKLAHYHAEELAP